jgi:site-specific recombinase XerD
MQMSIMPTKALPSLPRLLYSFFHEWLAEQRNASHRTVLAYRHAWRLFLCFVAERHNKKVPTLALDDLNRAEVLAFLQDIEKRRGVSIVMRNCRLAALRSFFTFVSGHEPLAALQCAASYLEPREVAAILARPNRVTAEGQRDHALLSLLYNTGARIQEALDLRPRDLHLKSPAHVRLMGKGQKERISPLWPETAELITALQKRILRLPDEPLFVNRHGEPLTASGFRFCLRHYVKAAASHVSTLSSKRVTPHLFRHSTAVRLIAAGVDVTVVQSWLGHADLSTTNRYAQANLETKRNALEQVNPKLRPAKPPRWKRDANLLAWLDSL